MALHHDGGKPARVSKKERKKWSVKKKIIVILCIILAVLLALAGGIYLYIRSLLGSAEYVELDTSQLGITTPSGSVEDIGEGQVEPAADITNIALFGVDTRDVSSDSGRSDALMILSVNRTDNQIKLISIARDSYVAVDGYGMDKITHAYAYGGPELAIRTINQNFNMDIQEFVTVNFAQLANIIDYVGGVYVNVDEDERQVLNDYIPELQSLGISAEPVEQAGYQLLTGGQAVAYSRDRYTGSDMDRTERQREVLNSLFDSVSQMDLTKLPGLASMVLSQCTTSLSVDEMLDLGTWAATSGPSFGQSALPNGECNARGQYIGTRWYYVYDLNTATEILHDYIYQDINP